MNKIYRCVWNEALGTWVAAPENTRSCKKSGRSKRLALLAPAALAVTLATAGLPQDAQACASAGITCSGTYTLDINSINQFNAATSSFEDDGVVNINIADGITTGSKDIYVHNNSVINAQVGSAIHGAYDYYGLNYPNIELNNNSVLNANAYNSVWNATIKLADQATFNINHDDATSTGLNIEFWDADTSLKLNGHSTTLSGVFSMSPGAGKISNGGSSDAELYINASTYDSVFRGDISDGGTGKLSLRLGGDHEFWGRNTYSGGTYVEYGHTQGYGYSFGTGDFDTGYDNQLTVHSENTTDSDVMSNNIIGGGYVHKLGAGSLTMTGNNTFAGELLVANGELIANANSLGNHGVYVMPSASLVISSTAGSGTTEMSTSVLVDHPDYSSGTFGGYIYFNPVAGTEINVTAAKLESTSDIRKNGLGTVTLQNNHTNNFDVIDGTLRVNGSAGNIEIYSGGTLAGTGTVKDVIVGSVGSIHPGVGRLTADNVTFDGHSTFVVTAKDSDGQSSQLEVNGTAKLNNAAVRVEAESSTWNTARTYTILTANNLEGSFSGLSANFAYLTPSLAYDNNQVELTLVRNSWDDDSGGGAGGGNAGGGNGGGSTGPRPGTGTTFASLAQTANQRGVANSVESLRRGHEVYNFVETLPVGAPAGVFNSLSGEAHASIISNLPGVSRHAATLPLSNMRTTLNAGLNPVAMTAQVGGTLGSSGLPATTDKPAWVQLVGNWQDVDGDRNAADLDQHSGGVFVGYDNEISNGWYLGGSLGYTDTDSKVSDRRSDGEISSYSATVYGGKAFALDTQRQLNVMAGLSYTLHDVETERDISGLEQKLKADYDVSSTQLFGEIGYVIGQPDKQYIEPFAGLTVTYLDADSFTERGGSAALKGKGETDTQTVSTLGVRAQTGYNLGNHPALLRGSLAWQHAFEDERMDRTLAFRDGSDAFAVKGVALARDTAVVGLGTQVDVSPTAAVSLDYEGKFASGLTDHGASVKVHWSF